MKTRHWRVAAGLVVVFAAKSAATHSRGLSQSTFELAPDGVVHGKLRLATADLSSEPRAYANALADFASHGVEVRADEANCPSRFVGSGPDGADGVAVDIDFACPIGAGSIEVELYFLSDLAASHQNVATLVAGGKAKQQVLDSSRRAIRLDVVAPLNAPTARRAWGWAFAAGGVGIAVALVLVAIRSRHRP